MVVCFLHALTTVTPLAASSSDIRKDGLLPGVAHALNPCSRDSLSKNSSEHVLNLSYARCPALCTGLKPNPSDLSFSAVGLNLSAPLQIFRCVYHELDDEHGISRLLQPRLLMGIKSVLNTACKQQRVADGSSKRFRLGLHMKVSKN